MRHNEMISVEGAPLQLHLSRPEGTPRLAVVLCHELFGVNDDMLGLLDVLARQGHLAVAPELYFRNAPPGTVYEKTDDGRREAFDQLKRVSREEAVSTVAATLRWLQASTTPMSSVLLGFSAGAHIAWLAAARLDVAATIAAYPGWLTSHEMPIGRPEPTLSLTPQINGRLLCLLGESDHVVPPAVRQEIARALVAPRHDLVTYPGVGHAFFWRGSPGWNEAARDDAWRRITALLADIG